MKSLAFILISALCFFGIGDANHGCESEQMNALCQSKVIDHCFTCENTQEQRPITCVPVFHNNLGVLKNYPEDTWNCTIYRPKDDEFENQDMLVKDICLIDDFIYDLCDQEDKNGFCLIASYIHDICEGDKYDMEIQNYQNYQVYDYVSPWGSKSECITKDYKEICSDSVTKSCFDCRTPTLLSYYHLCFPLFASENESALVTRLKKDKWECKKFSNPKYKPFSFQVYNVNSNEEQLLGGKLYSACTGPICSKEGWTYRSDHFGKEWCGNAPCKEYFGNRVLCTFPTNCNSKKSLSSSEHDNFRNDFHTLGCGMEKFKCMLKKSCRNLVNQLEKCDKDQICIYTVISQSDNETFNKLVECMFR